MTFRNFFSAIWGEERKPFPWQERLAELALAGSWPASVGLPTAAGKTALIDIAVFALAMRAPGAARRIFFVVDRRIIVDEAAKRAFDIAKKLCEAPAESDLGRIASSLREIGDGNGSDPLKTAVLRGGIPRDDSWVKSPRQPVVVCTTIDQLGSSLLFRAYGTNCYNWPIRAALASHDSLIILDEAHISQPFAQTLGRIREYRAWADELLASTPTLVEMSATPRDGQVLRESSEDREDPVLRLRWNASKRTRLVEEGKASEGEDSGESLDALVRVLAREARTMRDEHKATVIGVIANRVGTARAIYEALKKEDGAEAILMTGRTRPYDRDRIWKKWQPFIGLDRSTTEPSKQVFVVATQCIEVGANIDFDALVTEAASIDALEQRFGRLNRGGLGGVSHGAIIALKDQVSARAEDRIYGRALGATWRWLKEHLSKEERVVVLPAEGKKKPKSKKEKVEFVEMGVLALRKALEDTPDRSVLVADRKNAPVLMPAHMDLLSQTSPEPAVSPDPSLFLHGPQTEPADVQVVWRADLEEDSTENWIDTVAICPPSAAEAISLPLWIVRKWLCSQTPPDTGDMEGTPAEEPRIRGDSRPALFWIGPDESRILHKWQEVRPGMMLVVPSAFGGCDEWGWNPDSKGPVCDVADPVKLATGRPILRLNSALAEMWKYSELAAGLRQCKTKSEAMSVLESRTESDLVTWISETTKALVNGELKLVESPGGHDDTAAISGRAGFVQETRGSAFTREVELKKHLDGCKAWAERFALELPERLRKTITVAAEEHDIGKADPRFQAWLRGGNPVRRKELLAKSGRAGSNGAAIERARVLAGYPKGARHELMSVALLTSDASLIAAPGESPDIDSDLLLHLVGCHHGRCRPFAPVVEDQEPVEVRCGERAANSDHRLERITSGVSERFRRLNRRYGWYGLAYLETMLRLADHRRSEEEETKPDA